MDAELNKKSLMFGIPGIVLQIGGNVMVRMTDQAAPDMGMLLGGLAIALAGPGC